MSFLKAIVYGNIWVAIAVMAYVYVGFAQLGISVDWSILAFVFASSLATYNFQRIIRIKQSKLSGERIEWLRENLQLIKILTVVGASISLVCAFFLPFEILISYALLGLISFFYAYRYFNGKALRDMPYLKIYLIAFVWAMTSASPILTQEWGILYSEWLLILLEKMLFILAITIPFDIRDLKYDVPQKRTIPQIFGVSNAKAIAISCLVINLILVNYLYNSAVLPAFILSNCLAVILIYMSAENKKEWHYTFFLDGLPILLALALLVIGL